ncbi:MTRF1L release factor glutamine methyltransferase-like [Uranotaenia lowii]|uniref:MTRF1L release factor glutamine methyltransferase-like n=1 Tax=Uranotaenia lowii TaxID=190385 RepID=UPI00247A4563|nr:MTRF1L release factor glutamine methyltransferase-like [Uranotaenia lowii]
MFLSRSGTGALRQYLKGRSIQAMLSSDALNSTTWAPNSVRTVQDQWRSRFEQEKIPEPTTSITNILAHVLKLACPGDVEKHQKLELSKEQLSLLADLCECRMARMPIQYVIGQWDFGELTLKMAPPVFIPRPETEELVELILQQIDTDKEFRFLDVGIPKYHKLATRMGSNRRQKAVRPTLIGRYLGSSLDAIQLDEE